MSDRLLKCLFDASKARSFTVIYRSSDKLLTLNKNGSSWTSRASISTGNNFGNPLTSSEKPSSTGAVGWVAGMKKVQAAQKQIQEVPTIRV